MVPLQFVHPPEGSTVLLVIVRLLGRLLPLLQFTLVARRVAPAGAATPGGPVRGGEEEENGVW